MQKKIEIPQDILAQYDHPRQGENFSTELQRVVQLPPERVAEVKEAAKQAIKDRARGRPKNLSV